MVKFFYKKNSVEPNGEKGGPWMTFLAHLSQTLIGERLV